MEFDEDPGSGSIWHISMLLIIAVLMNAIAVFLLSKAFTPQRLAAPTTAAQMPATPSPAHATLLGDAG